MNYTEYLNRIQSLIAQLAPLLHHIDITYDRYNIAIFFKYALYNLYYQDVVTISPILDISALYSNKINNDDIITMLDSLYKQLDLV